MIALDSADGVLLDAWSADGTLPNLAALRVRGATRRLSSPEGVTDDALWASFQYATSIGEHGRYHWLQRLGSGKMGMAYLDEVNRESFWNGLSSEGFKIAIFDVPKCGFPRPINGIHLADWLVHGRYFRAPKSYPERLAAEVVEKFGPAPPSRCSYEAPDLTDADVLEVTANLRASAARKRAAGLHYLSSDAWDLFVIAFKEAHCACHHLWDLADPRHGRYDAARVSRLGDPIRTIFLDLDAAVGDLVAAAGNDAGVIVFSTADIEPGVTLAHLMPTIVSRLNRQLGGTIFARASRGILRGLFPSLAPRPCELLAYNDNCTALRVDAPRRFFRRLDQIEAWLRELKDADTGERVVAAIDRPSTIHAGGRAAALPDLLIRYASGTFPRAVISDRLGRIEANRPELRPGNHVPGGFLIYTREAGAGVTTMEDLGPSSADVLRGLRATSPAGGSSVQA